MDVKIKLGLFSDLVWGMDMSWELWILYVAASAGLSVTPGPNTLLALTHGALYGVRKTVFTSLGGAAGFALLMAISMAGLGALLTASPEAFAVSKWLGAAYLVYLGIKTWRSPPLQMDAAQRQQAFSDARRKNLFSQGFFVASSNPKGLIFFAAFLPQFMDPQSSPVVQYFIFAGTFIATELVVETSLSVFANKVSPWLAKASVGRWFNRITGGTFIGIGGFLAAINR